MTHSRSFIVAASASAQNPSPAEPEIPTNEPNYYDADISFGISSGTEVQIGDLRPGELGTREFSVGAGLTLPAGENWSVRYGVLFQTRSFETFGRVPFAGGKGLHVLALELRATRAPRRAHHAELDGEGFL